MLFTSILIVALVSCNAQESTEFMKVDDNVNSYGKFASGSIQQENSIGMCWNQLDKMGNVLESYRKLLMQTMMESNNICGIIKALTEEGTIDDNNNNIQEDPNLDKSTKETATELLFIKRSFESLDDAEFKQLLFNALTDRLNECYAPDKAAEMMIKRDKVIGQKIRFHSWGGKRNSKERPKVVIRAPVFHSWGGKRSMSKI